VGPALSLVLVVPYVRE